MLPVLMDLKVIKIYTFGAFLVLAFFWGSFFLWRNVRLTAHKEEELFDGLFFSLFGGLVISRLMYVLVHFDKFGFDVLKFLLINGYPGLYLYGYIIGGMLSFALFTMGKRIKFSEVIDYSVPPLFIALAIGKLGAFFSGTEMGTKTDFLLAVQFPNINGYRHLTSLYESVCFLIAAYISYKAMLAIRRGRYWKGFNFYFFWWYFSLIYFIFDPLKAFKQQIGGFSVNWLLATTMLLTFSLYFLYHIRTLILGRISKVIHSQHRRGHQNHRQLHQTAAEET